MHSTCSQPLVLGTAASYVIEAVVSGLALHIFRREDASALGIARGGGNRDALEPAVDTAAALREPRFALAGRPQRRRSA